MTKILVECPQQIASVRVGVLEPLRPLEEKGLCLVRYRDTKFITREDIGWCDIFVCVRGCEYPTLRAVSAAKKAGRFVVYFLDDDLLNIPAGNASTRYYRDNKIQVNLTRILGLSDVLWAVNQEIIVKYKKWCPRAVLLRVPAEILRLPPPPIDPVHILYGGSVDHSGLAQELLAPVVQKILSEYPGRVDFTFIGANPGLKNTAGVAYHSFFESYEAYHRAVLSGDFCIGLAPAYDLPFYACKYYNKFIEYSICGIAGIYSDCQPYQQIVRSGENGILCPNTFDGWYQAIKQLLDAPGTAGKMAQRASAELQKDFTYDAVSQSLQQQIPEITRYHPQDLSQEKIDLPSMQFLFYQERILLLFRMFGPLAVFVIPAKAVKKLFKMIQKKMRNE